MLLGTIFLLLFLEFLCRIAGFPNGANSYVEAIALRENLKTHKTAGEFQIFTYGESTMHGSHYWPFSNPPRWLEAYLKDFLPEKKIKIANFSRMGQGSDFVYRSFRDTVIYKPDLVIFYMGHNFFMPGNRVDQVRAKENRFSFRFKQWIRGSRLISAAIRLGVQRKMQRNKQAEADQVGALAIEAPPSGIGIDNKVVRGSDYYKENLKHHQANVEKILRLAHAKKIPILFFEPAGNLKDYPPTCSESRTPLTPEQKTQWLSDYEAGKKAQGTGDFQAAQQAYEAAYALDETYAELNYRLGQVYFKNGVLDKALKLFQQANDEDCIRVRASSDTQTFFEEIGKQQAVVLDTEKLLISEAPGGILGDPIVEDNVHFSLKGHAILGRAMAQTIADHGWIAPKEAWEFDSERSFEEMSGDLGITQELIFSSFLKVVSYFGSKFDSRILYAKKALAIHPDNPEALRHLAWAYWLKGDQPQALEVYKKLGEKAPDQLEQVLTGQPGIQEAFRERYGSAPAVSRTAA